MSYDVWFQDPLKIAEEQIGNKDYSPKRVFSSRTGRRQFSDFMSGNWAWQQAVRSNLYYIFSFSFDNRAVGLNC